MRPAILVLGSFLSFNLALHGQETVQLKEGFSPGYQYHVSSRSEITGQLALPAGKDQPAGKQLGVAGQSVIEYDERVLAAGQGDAATKAARIYRRIDFERTVGDRVQKNTVRPTVRRLVLVREKQGKTPFSPDGPLTWGEIDLIRTDVFTPALAGLLPEKPVRPADRWPAGTSAVQELTDMGRIDQGAIECRLEQLTSIDGRRHARVAFAGKVRGVNEDGPNAQELDGYFFFDLDSSHLSYLYLNGTSHLLNKDGKAQGTVSGRFVLTRQISSSADLSDGALRGLALEPNADNTLLLYDSPETGLRFLHPRHWRVAGDRGSQLVLDEPGGSGLLLTVELPANVPSGPQYLSEARTWLERQKAKILHIDPPRTLGGNPGLERFVIDLEMSGQRAVMHYYVIKERQGGATLAARLLPRDVAARGPEVERMARSVVVTERRQGSP